MKEMSATLDYGRSEHSLRNIIGKVTYGLVGLDKLLQDETEASGPYLKSFLSVLEQSHEQGGRGRHLLPEVDRTIASYDPRLKDELLGVAKLVQQAQTKPFKKGEIEKMSESMEAILQEMYKISKSSRSRREVP